MKINGIGKIILYLMCISVTFGYNILSFPFLGYQMTLFRLLTIILFTIYIISTKGKIPIFRYNKPVFNFLPILFIYSIVAVLWTKDLSEWFRYVFFIAIAVVALYLFSYYADNIGTVCKCLKCFGLSVVIQAAFGTYEYFTGNYFFVKEAARLFDYTRYGNYPVAMMYNVNDFAILMFAGVCVEFFMMRSTKRLPLKILHLLLASWYIFLSYQSSSRGALLAIVVALLFYLFTFTQKLSWKLVTIISFAVIGAYTYTFVSDLLALSTIDFSNDIRTRLAINGIHFFVQTVFMGTGPGQSGWWFAHHSVTDCGGVTIYHNLAIEMLATYGIIIFVMFICVYAKKIKKFFSMGRHKFGTEQNLAQCFCLFLVGLIVGGITSSSMIRLEWFWLVWVLMVCFYENNRSNDDSKTV